MTNYTCPACNGMGRHRPGLGGAEFECLRCDGTGVVSRSGITREPATGKATAGMISPAKRVMVRTEALAETGGRCWYCGVVLVIPKEGELVTSITCAVDHIVPRSKGGTDRADNLRASCYGCNSQKGSRSIEDYRAYLLRLQGGLFTEKQIAFWEARNIQLPQPKKEDWPVFYGETL